MPLDPSIYGLLDTKGLQSGLQGIASNYLAGQEHQARLSNLARQNELTDMQLRAGQRAEALIPEQKRQKDLQELSQALAFGIQQKNGISNQELMDRTFEEAKRRGLQDEDVAQLFQPWASVRDQTDGQAVSDVYLQKAYPAEAAKQRLDQLYARPAKTTPSQVNTLMQERAALAAQNPNDPNIATFDAAIKKATTITQPLVQIAGQGEVPIYATAEEARGKKAYKPAAKESQLSPQAQKELFEADENIQTATSVMDTLQQARQLNNQAYSGYGALLRAKAASNLPGTTDPKADATIQLDNLVREQALSSLKLVFGGNPTEGERSMLLELQGSAEKTPKQREAIFEKAEKMAANKLRFNQQKAESLRGGTYFKEAPQTAQPTAVTGLKVGTIQDGHVYLGGNPADPKSWRAK